MAENPLQNCDTLVIGVGGVNIGEIMGALCYLEKYNKLPIFKRIIGSSSASIIGLALLICQNRKIKFRDYTSSLFNIVCDRPFYDNINYVFDWYEKGIIKKGVRYRIIDHLMEFFQIPESYTFKEIYRETNVLFVTNGLCLDEKENYYFCNLTTPEMNIKECIIAVTSVIPFSTSKELTFPDGKIRRIYDAGCGPRFCPGCFLSSNNLYSLVSDPYFTLKKFNLSKEENTLAIILLPSITTSGETNSFMRKLIHYTLEKCWYDQKKLYPKMKTVVIPHNRFAFPSTNVLHKCFLLGQRCMINVLENICNQRCTSISKNLLIS